ncbi:MAG: hypothetical protein GXY88_10195 [Tissierellia bacterium]|nr:hypothetical protein [Tissierellia bacterium]
MKHVSIVGYDSSDIESKVEEWILENESSILEIVDVEYIENAGMYLATITYIERE